MTSSIATTRWPRATISARRRAPRGASVMRSSIPSACEELDLELTLGEGERVARGAVHLRHTAKGERILQVARRAFLPQVAAGEHLGERCERGVQSRIWTRLAHRRVEDREVGGERLEIE